MSVFTKRLLIEMREFSLCIWIKLYFSISFYLLPQSLFRFLTLFHVLLPKKVIAKSFSYIYKYWGQSLYNILKQRVLNLWPWMSCTIMDWNLWDCMLYMHFFPWRRSRVNMSSLKESDQKKGYEPFCACIHFEGHLSSKEY